MLYPFNDLPLRIPESIYKRILTISNKYDESNYTNDSLVITTGDLSKSSYVEYTYFNNILGDNKVDLVINPGVPIIIEKFDDNAFKIEVKEFKDYELTGFHKPSVVNNSIIDKYAYITTMDGYIASPNDSNHILTYAPKGTIVSIEHDERYYGSAAYSVAGGIVVRLNRKYNNSLYFTSLDSNYTDTITIITKDNEDIQQTMNNVDELLNC